MLPLVFVERGFISCWRHPNPKSDRPIRDGIRLKKFGPGTFIGCPDTLLQGAHTDSARHPQPDSDCLTAPGLDADYTYIALTSAITDSPCCVYVMDCEHLQVARHFLTPTLPMAMALP